MTDVHIVTMYKYVTTIISDRNSMYNDLFTCYFVLLSAGEYILSQHNKEKQDNFSEEWRWQVATTLIKKLHKTLVLVLANLTHPSYKRKLRVRYNELKVIANIIIQDHN